MSHFAVLCFGFNHEDQLEKYSENVEVSEYEVGIVSEKTKKRMLKYYRKNNNFKGDFDECYKQFGNNWNNNQYRKDENGVWHEYSTYNPDSKWDWYEVGGRWSGFFKMKDGTFSDCGLKKDIDLEGMKNLEIERLGKIYDEIYLIIKDLPVSKTWKSVLKSYGRKKIDDARLFYNSQERVVALRNNKRWEDIEDFQVSRKTFIERHKNGYLSTYAVLKDGVWYQKGKMGWFGISSGEMKQSVWDKKINEFVNNVPDDTLFTLIDCHI